MKSPDSKKTELLMSELIDNHLTNVLPDFSHQVKLKLPELKIPQLKKV